ncbi:NAD(P)-dependent methylenetetrahydromethanopterin dehydrogenase [Thiohalorhabdus methylotrophus]|uniref:NAD(P)-dependent methylenetetrahydromethanopterin dehydrogenase n=1 Tax=Thiohalorhabdus methylotrophus TaxID=3242694 RepID=A0ABV4TV51_9GAMM
MEQPYLLHMFDPEKNVSPFDINMAYDAGWDAVTPYTEVEEGDITDLVQDAIFSRPPKLGARTGIFIGGRSATVAKDMAEKARGALVPPFEASIMVDPSGAFTTAAAMLAMVESRLKSHHGGSGLGGRKIVITGGTGPVGTTAGILAAQDGAKVVLAGHSSLSKTQGVCDELNKRHGVSVEAGDGSSDEAKEALMSDAEIVLNCAAAGVQILSNSQLAAAPKLLVAADANAVPPLGLEGVDVQADAAPIEGSGSGAIGIGALALGPLKSQVEQTLLERMRLSEKAEYFHYEHALEEARRNVD